jgi:hypothetical protein
MRTARNRLAVLRSLSNQKCTFRTVSKTVMRRRSQASPDASFACSLAEATDDASKADVLGAKLDASLQPAGGGGDDAPPSTLPQPRPLAVAGAVVEAVAAPPRRMLAVAEEADAEAGEGSRNGTGNLLSTVSAPLPTGFAAIASLPCVDTQPVANDLAQKDATPLAPPSQSGGKKLKFVGVQIRFYGYTLGGSVPHDGGVPLGLSWDCDTADDLRIPMDDFEELRGANHNEGSSSGRASDSDSHVGATSNDNDDDNDDESDADREEEFSDDWRIPREFFQDEGILDADTRAEKLGRAHADGGGGGHRRLSLDLAGFQTALVAASRRKNARLVAAKLVLKGVDIDEAILAEAAQEASLSVRPVMIAWLRAAAVGHGARSGGIGESFMQRQLRNMALRLECAARSS